MSIKISHATIDNKEADLWMIPPDYAPPGPVDAEKHARRIANHSAYRINGHPTIWKNYIYYGFYMYDDCHDFLKAWKATVHDRLGRQRFIWREYHYRRLHNITVSNSTTLQKRVNEKTIPYLKEHDPDLWLASDMEYKEVLFFNDSANQSTTKTIDTEWHEVSPKRRSKKVTPPPSRERSPHSPTRKSVQISTETTETSDHMTANHATPRIAEVIVMERMTLCHDKPQIQLTHTHTTKRTNPITWRRSNPQLNLKTRSTLLTVTMTQSQS